MTANSEDTADSTADFERLANLPTSEIYIFRLFVSGMTARSTAAINNLTTICEQHLKGRYELEVVDLYKHPELAGSEQIFATPTLVKKLPLPLRNFVGTLSDEEQLLVGLNLVKKK